ncbi:MAG: hypothetical protein R3F46_14380 [bacterium]
MFRILWIVSWLGLLAAELRCLMLLRALLPAMAADGFHPERLSFWQLSLLPFCLMAIVALILGLGHFRVHTPSRTHWKQLVGMWIMLFWLLLFASQIRPPA